MALEQAGVAMVAQGANAFGADMASATKAVASFGAGVDTSAALIQDAAGRWRTSSGRFASDAEKAAVGVASVGPAAKGAGDAAKQAGADAEKGGHGFSAFGEIAIGALREVGKITIDVMGQAARATAGFVKDSIGLAGDFQQSMKEFQVAAGTGVDTAGLKQFRDLFIQLGKELPVSTADVQQAAIEMVKGGIDPATVAAGGLKQSIQFASAAMKGDLVGAAEISAKIVAGWAEVGASAAQRADLLSHATDQLARTANASSVDVHQLALGLYNVQGSAKAAGIGFDDVTTVLGELAGDFSSAATAGTSLNAFIARLQPNTADATAKMEELGLMTTSTTKILKFLTSVNVKPLGTDLDTLGNQFTEFATSQGFTAKETDKIWQSFSQSKFYDEATGKFIGFQQTSQLLQNALQGLTDAERVNALQTIFQTDAMGAASGLASRGAAGYDAMAASLQKAMGVQEAAATQQDSYNTAVKNAQGSFEALQLTIGSAFLPVLTALMNNTIAPAVNTFTTMASAIGGDTAAFASLSPALQGVVTTMGVLIADVQGIVGAFTQAGAGSRTFSESVGVLAGDLGLPGKLIAGIVTATQGLVASFQDGGSAAQHLGGIVTNLTGVWNIALKTATDVSAGYLAIAQAVLPVVTQFWADHGTQISTFLTTTYATINRIVTTGLQLYGAVVPPILQAIAGFFASHGTAIASILTGAYNVIAGIVTGGLALIEGVITTALDLIHGDYIKAWADITTMSATFVTSLGQVITGGLEIIAGAFGTSLADIGKVWQHNWDMLVAIAVKVGSRMVDAGKSMVQGIIKGIEDEAGTLYQALISMGQNAFDNFMKGIKGGSPALVFVPAGESVVQGLMLGMQNTIPGLMGLVDGMGIELNAKLGKISSDLQKQISDAVTEIQNKVKDAQHAVASLAISGYGATANIDRQKLTNLDALGTVAEGRSRTEAQARLEDAEREAAVIQDSKQAADYFKLRSDQIIELAKLQDGINAATDQTERQRLIARYQIAEDAQQNERAAQAAQAAQGSATLDVAKQLQELLSSSITAKGQKVDLPGFLGNAVLEPLHNYLDRLTSPAASPAYIGGTPAWQGGDTYGPTLNMPIYTNNSPSAIQQSVAIAGAML